MMWLGGGLILSRWMKSNWLVTVNVDISFTDRILHARGAFETMLLGAETAAPLLKALLPDARFEFRQRMSQLVYAGPKKLTRLPRRSAVVAFSASDVYQIAEFVQAATWWCGGGDGAVEPTHSQRTS